MKHLAILLCTVGMVTGPVLGLRGQHRSMVQQEIIMVPGITQPGQIPNLDLGEKQTIRAYKDGLGRTVQKVVVGSSPLQRDIIGIRAYDHLGRQAKVYLPYVGTQANAHFRINALDEQAAFYANGTADKIADDPMPYQQQVWEESPLQRLLQTGSIGDGYQPGQHDKDQSYRLNTAADGVWQWRADETRNGVYPASSLSVVQTMDEEGNYTVLFTDKNGRTVLERRYADETVNGTSETYFDTYYIYYQAGPLRAVIPPKAVSIMRAAADWDLAQPDVSRLLFRYAYDDHGRLTRKKMPEMPEIYIVYDPLERPVLVQDGKLRESNQWNYIKYDIKGRVASQGIYTDAVRTTLSAMQAFVDQQDYSVYGYEEPSTGAGTGYYSNRVFPTSNIEPLAYGYYDGYDLDQNGAADYSYQSQGLTNEAVPDLRVRGRLTAMRTRTIGAGLSDIWMVQVHFYDKWGNIIQVRSNNHLNTLVADSRTVIPDFRGKPVQVKTVQSTGASSTHILTTYQYDHAERLTLIEESYNGATPIRIAEYEYNELGQLVDKKLHSTDGGNNYLQSVDFRYDIRGQLVSINNSQLGTGSTNDDTDDLFGMELLYGTADAGVGNTPFYNGQLSGMKWMSKNPLGTAVPERAYQFDYDKLGRLKDALYRERSHGGSWQKQGAFDEKNIAYDQNGNILKLQRNGYISGGITLMDNLDYSYDGNRLASVSDAGSATLGLKNLTGSTAAYGHDGQGNLIADPKKGITMSYNALNRPERVTVTTATGRYIDYTYDAGGTLLRKEQYDNNTLVKTTDYIGSFVYENSSLSHFAMAEGRVRYTGTGLKPEYMLTDQQGNVRLSFEEQGGQAVVRQENSYYPYGLVMPGGSFPAQPNRNLYNGGSEWQNDYGDLPDYYRTYYRNYDAALARFVSTDPLADATMAFSPYHYAGNNPLRYNDPLGDRAMRPYERQEPLSGFINPGRRKKHRGDGIWDLVDPLWNSKYGGFWNQYEGFGYFNTETDAFYYGAYQISEMNGWGDYGWADSYEIAAKRFNASGDGDVKTAYRQYFVVGYYYRDSQGRPEIRNGVSGAFRKFIVGDGIVNAKRGNHSWIKEGFELMGSSAYIGELATRGRGMVEWEYLRQAKLNRALSGNFSNPIKHSLKAISKAGRFMGVAGTVATYGVAGYEVATGSDNTSTWVDVGVTTGIVVGGIISAPVAIGAGIIYGGTRLFWGNDIDRWIDTNWGYR